MSGSSATLDPEWSLLLAACSAIPAAEKHSILKAILQQPISWKNLFDRAERHGTQPLLYHALLGLEDMVPLSEMRSLQQAYQTNLHKSLLLSRELIRIVDCLSALEVEVIPYKGVALAEAVYGDIALRQSGDIDLLIRPHDLRRIRDAVRELGYTPQEIFSGAEEHAYMKSGYECAFDGPAGRNLLEVQWAVQPRFYAVEFDMDGLFQRAVNITVAGRPMKTPGFEDLFLVLSVHAAKHVWGRLVWLCDLAQLMSLPNLDWKTIGSQARKLGIVRILRVTILLANQLLGTAIPAAAHENLPEDGQTQTLAPEIQTHISSWHSYNVESLAYFRLMMRLRERPADRLRFLSRLILTPGPGEWNAVRLAKPLFPLYRLVRLARVAARIVRR